MFVACDRYQRISGLRHIFHSRPHGPHLPNACGRGGEGRLDTPCRWAPNQKSHSLWVGWSNSVGFCPRVSVCRIWFSIHCVSRCSFQTSHFTPVVHFVLLYALDCWAGLPVYRHWWALYLSSIRPLLLSWLHQNYDNMLIIITRGAHHLPDWCVP